MLDLLKIAGQMQGMSEQLQREAKQLAIKLNLAEELFKQAIANQAILKTQYQAWQERLAFSCGEPVEELNQISVYAPMQSLHSVIATDGSQISPSRHEVAYCYLINVGRVALHYGDGAFPVLDNVPQVYYKSEDLYKARKWGIQTEEWMSLRRTADEAIALGDFACQHQKSRPILALSDGSLIHWNLEMLPAGARHEILPDIITSWDRLRLSNIPVAGYISSPRAVESINFLRLQACPFEERDCATHCGDKLLDAVPCSKTQPLRDASLWQRVLKFGECSPLWRSHAKILQEYGEHSIYFCYLHVGSEVARVEMPEWTALDPKLRSQCLEIILAQVQKGYGYPVVLAEAHNQAVVTGGDRYRFFAMLERQMIQAGLRNVGTSFKETRKRGSIA
jgi:NurA domain